MAFPGGNIVRVTPTVVETSGDAVADDLLFDTTEIPGAVSNRGGTSLLVAVGIIDYDKENHDMDIVFMRNNVSMGTIDAGPSWTDANIVSAELIGGIDVDWDVAKVNVAAAEMAFFSGTNRNANTQQLPMMLQAKAGSRSVYFGGIARDTIDYAASTNLEFIFHIQYLD